MSSPAVMATALGPVGRLTLHRPDKRNALTAQMYADVAAAFERWADDDQLGAIVLTGSGGSFTAGNEVTEIGTGDVAPAKRFLAALLACRLPVIAALDGPALGIGTTVLLHCDLVLATPRSTFGLPFVDLGLIPEAGCTLLLPRRVGRGRATRLALLGERIDAATALAWNLVDEICPDEPRLLDRAQQLGEALAGKPREALLTTRALLHDDTGTLAQRMDRDARLEQLMVASLEQRVLKES